eukprot:gene20783-27607_t
MHSALTRKHCAGVLSSSAGRGGSHTLPVLLPSSSGTRCRLSRATCFPTIERAHGMRSSKFHPKLLTYASKDDECAGSKPDGDVEVTVDSVKVHHTTAANVPWATYVVYLRIVGSERMLPVHIGEAESNAIMKELKKSKQPRPMTHDLTKSLMQACGVRVTKIRITELVASTYYSRVYVGKLGGDDTEREADVDARPSDAINLALRFGAPMFISKRVAANVTTPYEAESGGDAETHADIVLSVRSALSSFEDPTVMYQLQKSLAIQQQRFEDAAALQKTICHEMTHNQTMRLVVAMEAALADARYEEAARLRGTSHVLSYTWGV